MIDSLIKLARSVLIPSFSGLWLVELECGDGRGAIGLNPFFFRSLVGLRPLLTGILRTCLNPFFFRSLVGLTNIGHT